jgi:hypothetical protein
VSPDNPPPRIAVVTTGRLAGRIYMDDDENRAYKKTRMGQHQDFFQ